MATGHKRRGRRQAGGHPFEKGVDVVNDVLKNFLNGMGVGMSFFVGLYFDSDKDNIIDNMKYYN